MYIYFHIFIYIYIFISYYLHVVWGTRKNSFDGRIDRPILDNKVQNTATHESFFLVLISFVVRHPSRSATSVRGPSRFHTLRASMLFHRFKRRHHCSTIIKKKKFNTRGVFSTDRRFPPRRSASLRHRRDTDRDFPLRDRQIGRRASESREIFDPPSFPVRVPSARSPIGWTPIAPAWRTCTGSRGPSCRRLVRETGERLAPRLTGSSTVETDQRSSTSPCRSSCGSVDAL